LRFNKVPSGFVRDVRRIDQRSSDWGLLIGATVAQLLTACAVRTVSLQAVRAMAARLRPLLCAILRASDERVIWAVEATGRRLGGSSTCLVRAIVVQTRLTAPGRPLCLTIGVKAAAAGDIQSHAWVVDRARILIGGPADPDLVPIVVWESAA
jgi:hypothetical protein